MRNLARYIKIIIIALLAMSTATVSAQYVTEDEISKQKESDLQHKIKTTLDKLIGSTFWIVPNPKAYFRVTFFNADADGKVDDRNKFFLTKETSFVIDEVHRYKFLKVHFPDGKIGFIEINTLFFYDPASNSVFGYLFDGEQKMRSDSQEYIYSRSPQELFAAEKKTALSNKLKQAKSAAAWKARGGVRVGMTANEARNSNWGKPNNINRSTTSNTVREQWVYGGNSYLYFENGTLTSIQN